MLTLIREERQEKKSDDPSIYDLDSGQVKKRPWNRQRQEEMRASCTSSLHLKYHVDYTRVDTMQISKSAQNRTLHIYTTQDG